METPVPQMERAYYERTPVRPAVDSAPIANRFRLILVVVPIACARLALSADPVTVQLRPYLTCEGQDIDLTPPLLSREDNAVRISFTPSRTGTYRFGIAIEANRIVALSRLRHEFVSGQDPSLPVLHYPYDWTWHSPKGNVLWQPRLILPGVEADGRLYVIDTHELTSIRFDQTGRGRVRALLLKHRFYNDGGDAASPDLMLREGENQEMVLRDAADLAAVNRARFGEMFPIKGRIAPCNYRGWTKGHFSATEYEKVAASLAGTCDAIITREARTHDWLPTLFHRRGLKAISYQFMGARRRNSEQLDSRLEAEIGLNGAGGQRYTCPQSPDGAWLFCDIRRADVRERFVEHARTAVAAGFDGVFLDGYGILPDTTGRRGGSVPDAMVSLVHARWQLLVAMKAAMREANPKAILGVLGNQYYDALGVADFVMKERMHFGWVAVTPRFAERETFVAKAVEPFEQYEAAYVPGAIAYGAKGCSPIAVHSSMHFVHRLPDLWFFDPGDFFLPYVDEFLDTLVDVLTQSRPYLTGISPETVQVHFVGRSRIWCPHACEITFSDPMWVMSPRGELPKQPVAALRMAPNVRYQICRTQPVPIMNGAVLIVDRRPATAAIEVLADGQIRSVTDCTVAFSELVDVLSNDDTILRKHALKLQMATGRTYSIRTANPE